MPEFAEEAAEVNTTKLTTDAAIPSPARLNMATKGLLSALISRHGVTMMITARATT